MSGTQRTTSSLLLLSQGVLYHTSPLTELLSFLPIIPLTALPLSVLLSGENHRTTKDFSSEGQESGPIPGQWTRTDSEPRVFTRQTRCGAGVKATYRHAAFLNRTLGEPSSMQCSIMCVPSPDWVALKCKYLSDKAVIWVNTEGHCVVLGKEKHPLKLSAWKPASQEAFLKRLIIYFFLLVWLYPLYVWDGIFMGAISFSTVIHWKPAAILRPRLSLVH